MLLNQEDVNNLEGIQARAKEMIKELGVPVIQWVFPLCTSRPDIWEDCQITGCVLFGSGKTRRCGLTCLQLSCQQPVNYCVFSPPPGLSVYIFKVLLKIVASNLFALISWIIADSVCLRPPWVLEQATVAPHNSAFPRESVSGDKDSPPLFPLTCLDIKRVRFKPVSLETYHLPCLFLVPLLGVWAKSYQAIAQEADLKSVFPISLMSKQPRLQWRELVKLLQPSRPECFTQRSQGPTQLPRRPGANEALFLLATSSLRLGSSMLSFRLSEGMESCVQPGKRGGGC